MKHTSSVLLAVLIWFIPFNTFAGHCPGNWGITLGSFQNITAYSNGSDVGCSHDCSGNLCYQCVEYVKRFYANEVGDAITQSWGVAANAYDYGDPGLNKYAQDGSMAPEVGDVLCFDDGSAGHASIITEVGTGHVKYIDQNRTTSSSDIIKQANMTLSSGQYNVDGFGSYDIEGWLRDPDYEPDYAYSGIWQSQTPTDPSGILYLQPDEVIQCSFTFNNNGSSFWSSDGYLSHYVELHSVNSSWSQDLSSGLAYNWISGSDIKITTVSSDADIGSSGTFNFQIKTPSTPGNYTLYVALYNPHTSSFISGTGPKIEIEVLYPPPTSTNFTTFMGNFNNDMWDDVGLHDHDNGNWYISLRNQNAKSFIANNEPWLEGVGGADYLKPLLVTSTAMVGTILVCTRTPMVSGMWP